MAPRLPEDARVKVGPCYNCFALQTSNGSFRYHPLDPNKGVVLCNACHTTQAKTGKPRNVDLQVLLEARNNKKREHARSRQTKSKQEAKAARTAARARARANARAAAGDVAEALQEAFAAADAGEGANAADAPEEVAAQANDLGGDLAAGAQEPDDGINIIPANFPNALVGEVPNDFENVDLSGDNSATANEEESPNHLDGDDDIMSQLDPLLTQGHIGYFYNLFYGDRTARPDTPDVEDGQSAGDQTQVVEDGQTQVVEDGQSAGDQALVASRENSLAADDAPSDSGITDADGDTDMGSEYLPDDGNATPVGKENRLIKSEPGIRKIRNGPAYPRGRATGRHNREGTVSRAGTPVPGGRVSRSATPGARSVHSRRSATPAASLHSRYSTPFNRRSVGPEEYNAGQRTPVYRCQSVASEQFNPGQRTPVNRGYSATPEQLNVGPHVPFRGYSVGPEQFNAGYHPPFRGYSVGPEGLNGHQNHQYNQQQFMPQGPYNGNYYQPANPYYQQPQIGNGGHWQGVIDPALLVNNGSNYAPVNSPYEQQGHLGNGQAQVPMQNSPYQNVANNGGPVPQNVANNGGFVPQNVGPAPATPVQHATPAQTFVRPPQPVGGNAGPVQQNFDNNGSPVNQNPGSNASNVGQPPMTVDAALGLVQAARDNARLVDGTQANQNIGANMVPPAVPLGTPGTSAQAGGNHNGAVGQIGGNAATPRVQNVGPNVPATPANANNAGNAGQAVGIRVNSATPANGNNLNGGNAVLTPGNPAPIPQQPASTAKAGPTAEVIAKYFSAPPVESLNKELNDYHASLLNIIMNGSLIKELGQTMHDKLMIAFHNINHPKLAECLAAENAIMENGEVTDDLEKYNILIENYQALGHVKAKWFKVQIPYPEDAAYAAAQGGGSQ